MVSDDRILRRAARALKLHLIWVCLIGLPLSALAAKNCPWINEATASGLLGGEAVGEASEAVAGQAAVCSFTQRERNLLRTLRVTVEVAADAHAHLGVIAQGCRSAAIPVKAIGNEAFVCADDRRGGIGEKVLGRVRDQVFTITITTTLKKDPVLTRDALQSRIYTAAEQVAGNLF